MSNAQPKDSFLQGPRMNVEIGCIKEHSQTELCRGDLLGHCGSDSSFPHCVIPHKKGKDVVLSHLSPGAV